MSRLVPRRPASRRAAPAGDPVTGRAATGRSPRCGGRARAAACRLATVSSLLALWSVLAGAGVPGVPQGAAFAQGSAASGRPATAAEARTSPPAAAVAAAASARAPGRAGAKGTEVVDVLVIGSQPEAISAAVAAGEQGARTVLLTSARRLGGLFVRGELNVLDLRTTPRLYQRGLFLRWWRRVGEKPAFDIGAAERAFSAMLANAGVQVIRGAPTPVPLLNANGRLLGARAGDRTILARQVIDGQANAQFAAAAGAPFTVGWASIGVHERMADTLIFGLRGVNWQALSQAVKERGGSYAHVRDNVVWGPFGGYPAAYRPTRPGLRMRGLNLGRESDGTVLVNALLVYGANPLDPASLAAARARAAAEVPAIVRYLDAGVPGFQHARLSGVAPRMYVRESRHLEAQCVLRVGAVLDNKVTPLDVAAGGYPLDVQSLTPQDTGYVFGTPHIYGARLCMTVAPKPAPLWVVGKTAGFGPIAFASARVVPFGMAIAEAVGVAAARAARLGLDPAALAASPAQVRAVRGILTARGAYLPAVKARAPVGPVSSPYYGAFRLLLSRGLAVGGYDNDPHLEQPISKQGFLYLLSNVAQRFFGNASAGPDLVARFGLGTGPLEPSLALSATYEAACRLGACPPQSTWAALQRSGLAPKGFAPTTPLDRGQAYALAAGVARLAADPPPP